MEIMMMPEGFASIAREDEGERRYYGALLRLYLDPYEKLCVKDIEQVARCCTHDDACVAFRMTCRNNRVVVIRIFLEHKGHAVAHLPEIIVKDNDIGAAFIELGRNVLEYYIQSHCYEDESELKGVRAMLAWTQS